MESMDFPIRSPSLFLLMMLSFIPGNVLSSVREVDVSSTGSAKDIQSYSMGKYRWIGEHNGYPKFEKLEPVVTKGQVEHIRYLYVDDDDNWAISGDINTPAVSLYSSDQATPCLVSTDGLGSACDFGSTWKFYTPNGFKVDETIQLINLYDILAGTLITSRPEISLNEVNETTISAHEISLNGNNDTTNITSLNEYESADEFYTFEVKEEINSLSLNEELEYTNSSYDIKSNQESEDNSSSDALISKEENENMSVYAAIDGKEYDKNNNQSCSWIFSCEIVEDNFIGLYPHVETEMLCQDHCLKSANCTFYTWFQKDFDVFPNLCFMFSSCEEKTFSCNSCQSGPPKCLTTIPPKMKKTFSTTSTTIMSTTISPICDIPKPQKHGDWFCPPSIYPATCHLECHPGYVSTNATVITCQHQGWTEAPECITAVAIITGGDDSEKTVEVYGEGIHKSLPNLLYGRDSHTLQLVNSILLLCGGYPTKPSCLSLTTSLQWITHSTTTNKRSYHSSVSIMGQLHLLGGDYSKSTTEHLTPPSQDWRSGWDLLEDTRYACAAKIEPQVLIVTGGNHHRSSVVAYNVTNGAATRLKNMNTQRSSHGCAFVMDSNMRGVLVAGGQKSHTGKGNYLSESEIYNVNTGEWSTMGKLTTRRAGVRLVVLGNKILALGGYNPSESFLSTVDNFNMTTKQWTPTEEMMEKRSQLAVTGVPSTTLGIELN